MESGTRKQTLVPREIPSRREQNRVRREFLEEVRVGEGLGRVSASLGSWAYRADIIINLERIMKMRCLMGHKWNGCSCEQCDAVRDEGHEWLVRECRRICAKCGQIHGFEHAWHRCSCQQCQATRHFWQNGICLACGQQCDHVQTEYVMDDPPSWNFTAHGAVMEKCSVCGLTMSVQPHRPDPVILPPLLEGQPPESRPRVT